MNTTLRVLCSAVALAFCAAAVGVIAGCQTAPMRVVASSPEFIVGAPGAGAEWPAAVETIAVQWQSEPGGRLSTRAVVEPGQSALALRPVGARPSEVAVFESAVLSVPTGFNEAVLSWNADVPAESGLRIEMRAGRLGPSSTMVWSPWLYVGRAGAAKPDGDGAWLADTRQQFANGKIDVDYFTSPLMWHAVQLRVTAWWDAPAQLSELVGPVVRLRRLVVQVSRDVPAADVQYPQPSPGRGRIGVPFRSQRTSRMELAGRLCSPTSLAMVLAHRGVDRPVLEVAQRAWDADNDLYGNWPRNVQAAFELGPPGYLCRFTDWRQVEAVLARGQPIIASIRVRPGELPAAPFPSTDGHLIVIDGMDEQGDLLVLDPSVSTFELGARVYPRRDMQRVWFGHAAGTAYVIEPAPKTAGSTR